MIPFDFSYHRPDSVKEAVDLFLSMDAAGRQVLYYGGGSEIISMARANNIYTDAVIDIKGIPECNTFEVQNEKLIIGAAITLSQISESGLFPLLGQSGGRVADHTIQGKITLGGNIAGTIIYREAVLPLLLADTQVVVAGLNGKKQVPIAEVFSERLNLGKGEFLVQTIIDKAYAALPYVHVKKTKQDKIDYPLITVAAIKKDSKIRIAFSGLCHYPFRSTAMEEDLSNTDVIVDERINNAINHIPGPILNDTLSSADYRKFVLRNMLAQTLRRLEAL